MRQKYSVKVFNFDKLKAASGVQLPLIEELEVEATSTIDRAKEEITREIERKYRRKIRSASMTMSKGGMGVSVILDPVG